MFRGRRLRRNQTIRSLVQETKLSVDDLIYPIFVIEGKNIKQEIKSLPNNYQYSLDRLPEVIQEMQEVGLKACILFGIVDDKDEHGTKAYCSHGIVQEAIRKIKSIDPNMYVIGDVCMCEYTSHGHCGILDENDDVDNDKTLIALNKIALSYAQAGVDMIAPSDMMDMRVASIRKYLDEYGYYNLPIMSYSIKYASNFYGPFREAANSAPSFGNRKSYQMDYHNKKEAMREMEADIEEGADIIMVKPAMSYLDIINTISTKTNLPICAYQVSGEYNMLYEAVKNQAMNEEVIYESLIGIKRAGADLIITYFALDIARKMKESYEA